VIDKLVQLVTDFAYLFRFIAIVRDYEGAVVLRLGRYKRTLEPGWYFVAPFKVDEVLTTVVTPSTTNLPAQTVTTADDVQVSVAAIVTWEVSNVRKLLLESAEHQEAMLDTSLGLVARSVMAVTWRDLGTEEFRRTLRRDVKTKAKRWGIRVLDVQLTDIARTRTFRLLSSSPSSRGAVL
jgi:regulator of protease activity HflC (stomatin/prohibitin superfamily)